MIAQSSLRNHKFPTYGEVLACSSDANTSQNWRSMPIRRHACKVENSSLPQTQVLEVRRFFELYQSAKLFCDDIPENQLKNAVVEAIRLMHSGIFSYYIQPDVGIDECGEISFTHKNERGYLDIGISGTGEISFHVRNDFDPTCTVFGDEAWNGVVPPENLLAGVVSLLQE